jgi:hypothetical protein
MENNQLDLIAKMLRAQLMSASHLWWVSGYIYGQTSNGDVFVILYPSAENLKEKVVRVYPHDFKKLPSFIPTDIDGGDTEANPSKDQARKKGIYHECPAFEIVTYDGKDTQMGKERRFGDVLRLSKAARDAVAQVGRAMPPSPPPPNVGAPTPPPAQRPAAPPPPPEPPAEEFMELPDFRGLALEAATEQAFDYAAFMALRNGLYAEQEHITKTREMLVPAWKPGQHSRPNAAMLAALETYRDKRYAAEQRGEASGPAHSFAKREAMRVYNKEIGK